jgi:two-component sensor histidine kinase
VLVHLIDMQSEATQTPEVLQMFRALQQRIQTMAMVHAQLYQSQDLGRIDFGDYLRNLTSYLYESLAGYRHIALNIEADEAFIHLNLANPCGLIVNELVTNALKYAFPQESAVGDEIRVEFRLKQGDYVLTVSDNGVGLPPGFDWRNTESLGLKLVNILAEYQLRGRVEVGTWLDSSPISRISAAAPQERTVPRESDHRKGATFTIRFAERRK